MNDKTKLEVTSQSGRWATFFLADEMLAVRVEDVQEVMMQQPLTPVPLAPSHIVGLLNLRGQIMPAIDLRRRLQFPVRPDDSVSNLLVLKLNGDFISVVVDDIGDVLDLPAENWQPPPDTLVAQHRNFVFAICPIDKHVVLGLRVEALSGEDDRPTHGN